MIDNNNTFLSIIPIKLAENIKSTIALFVMVSQSLDTEIIKILILVIWILRNCLYLFLFSIRVIILFIFVVRKNICFPRKRAGIISLLLFAAKYIYFYIPSLRASGGPSKSIHYHHRVLTYDPLTNFSPKAVQRTSLMTSSWYISHQHELEVDGTQEPFGWFRTTL